MNYNWGDPKKNSKLTAIMMTKAEASRKKRLSSVKSTLSNQLHPGTESKLKKKKKSPESARREAGEFDPELAHLENNNHLEPTYDPSELAHLKLPNSNNDFNGLEEYSASSSHPRSTPIFEEFSLNAAAEGLFHPASTIEAFIEHDAKYNSKISAKGSKPSSGRSSLSSRSGSRSSTVGEYLPSLETQKLPVLLNEKGKRVKLDSTSSSSSLLDSPGRGSSRNHTMSSTRSDSDLHAPRRLSAVPSSADRNALDFYDHEDGTDDESEDDHLKAGFRANTSPPNLGGFSLSAKIGANDKLLSSSKSTATLSEPEQQEDNLLTKKFEDLKLLMNAKKKSKQSSSVQHQDAKQDTQSAKTHTKSREGSSTSTSSTSNNSSGVVKLTDKSTSNSRIAKSTSNDVKSVSESRRKTNTTMPVPIVLKTPPIKSKKNMKIRNGVSLSDLKEEHRAALEMLKELGGPVDTDYENVDPEDKAKASSLKTHSTRATKAKDTVKAATSTASSRSQNASSNAIAWKPETMRGTSAPSSASSREQHEKRDTEPQSSSPLTHTGGSLVAKLRASIPSGRVKTPEFAEQVSDNNVELSDAVSFEHAVGHDPVSHTVAAAMTLTQVSLDEIEAAAAITHTASFVLSRQERSLENVEELDEGEDSAEAVDNGLAFTTNQHDGEPDLHQVKFGDSWRQYEDEDEGDDDEGDEEEDVDPNDGGTDKPATGGDDQFVSEYNRSAPATARSVDMYGDEGFESEW